MTTGCYRPKACPVCGEVFSPASPTHTFCQKSCQAAHLQTRKPPRGEMARCLTCGKAFAPYNRNHKYCSSKCRPSKQKPVKPVKPKGGKNRPYTPDTVWLICKWFGEGLSIGQIMQILGRSRQSVVNALKIGNLKKAKGEETA